MFENIISFRANEAYIDSNQDILPIPAKLNIPEWFKKLQHTVDKKTVKGCMPFLDSITAGYILKLPIDYHVKHNVMHEGKRQTGADSPQAFYDGLSQKINLNLTGYKEFHNSIQLEGSPLVEKNSNLAIHKILNPWIIKTPPGYSTLFIPPLNNTDDRFEIITGIVDTDIFENEINFPIIFNGDKYESLDTILPRGTPYVQCIPFKRDRWKFEIKKQDEKKYDKSKFFEHKFMLNNYKKMYWQKKSWK
tara:strand:+ start:881 stop:1624 length:744 start_codon:yes stop_codon:yes gene_type:complete